VVILLGTVLGLSFYGSGLSETISWFLSEALISGQCESIGRLHSHLILFIKLISQENRPLAIQNNKSDRTSSFPWFGVSANIGFQLPFYSTFHLDKLLVPSQAPPRNTYSKFLITGLFTSAAIWIFLNFKSENTRNRIVKKPSPIIAESKEVDQSLGPVGRNNKPFKWSKSGNCKRFFTLLILILINHLIKINELNYLPWNIYSEYMAKKASKILEQVTEGKNKSAA